MRPLLGACVAVAVPLAGCAEVQGPDRDPEPPRPQAAKPPRLTKFDAQHWADRGTSMEHQGRIGKDSFVTRFGDFVKLAVDFEQPAHAYLIAYNADGSEQLLWPVNDQEQTDANVPPKASRSLRFPVTEGKVFTLDDEPKGGWQAFAVVASSRPLPPFATWKSLRGEPKWKRRPPGSGVWCCDAAGVYWQGDLPQRGAVERKPPPDLEPLGQSLKTNGVELVELIAFSVRPKEK